MEAPRLINIDNKIFMSTKAASDLWHLKPRTIANYCNKGKIINKFKNGRYGWYISVDEPKPLSKEEIHKLLVLTIQLKNNPKLEIDWSTFNFDDSAIDSVYRKLVMLGYIFPYNLKDMKRIPYEIILTQKGLETATKFNKTVISDFSTTLSQWLPVIINLAQLCIQIKEMA